MCSSVQNAYTKFIYELIFPLYTILFVVFSVRQRDVCDKCEIEFVVEKKSRHQSYIVEAIKRCVMCEIIPIMHFSNQLMAQNHKCFVLFHKTFPLTISIFSSI